MANNGVISGEQVFKGDVLERIKAVDNGFKEVLRTYTDLGNQLKNATSIPGIETSIKKTNAANEKQVKLLTQLAKLKKEEANAIGASERAKASEIRTKSAEVSLNNKITRQNSRLNSYYKQQSASLNRLRDTYKSLALKKVEGIALSKIEQIQYQKLAVRVKALDSALKKVDASAGQFNRSVANYPKGIKSAVGALRSFAGALGFTSGIFLFASAMKDAFKRVKEFDEAMQNVSGILQTTRKDLGGLEAKIISVAGESRRTSTEVAALAETLAGLGKKEDDIQNLLKPVIDLSVGLKTTSAEAGEFLVQMLNAFEAPTSSAEEFATTIAGIRNSTTLDFQRMRDSFQYLAPISNLLGRDLAYTGAVVGILADNSLKAESAGRLLSTAQLRLAKSGKSLQDGLDIINKAYKEGKSEIELASIAAKLFGANAAKVGVILAKNADKININSEAIRKNKDALSSLVNENLDSLSAKVDIMDSAWERLILTVESGNGSFGKFFKGTTEGITGWLKELADAEEAQSKVFEVTGAKKGFLDYIKKLHPLTSLIKTDYEELEGLQRDFLEYNKNIGKDTDLGFLKDELDSLNTVLKENTDLTKEQRDTYINQRNVIEDLYNSNLKTRNELKEQAYALVELGVGVEMYAGKIETATNKQLEEFINKNKKVLDGVNKLKETLNDSDGERTLSVVKAELNLLQKELLASTKDEKDAILDKIAVLEKEAEAWKRTGRAKVDNKKIIEGSIDAYQELIKELRELQESTATTTEEYKKFDDQIAQTERKIKQLKEGLDSLNKVETISILTPVTESPISIEDKDSVPDPVDINQGIIDQQLKQEEDKRQVIKSINEGVLSDYKRFKEKETRVLTDALNLQQNIKTQHEEETRDIGQRIAFTAIDSILDARLNSIDEEIQANQERLSSILNSEEATEEQKLIAKQAAEKEDKKLQKEKAKREKQAFLISQGLAIADIAINLSKTIAAINAAAAAIDAISFGTGGQVYRAANIPLAIGTAAAQTGLVLAQTIPQFYKGTNNAPEGWAETDERGAEIHTDKRGNIKDLGSNKGSRYKYLEKGDKIITASKSRELLKNIPDLTNHDFEKDIKNINVLKSLSYRIDRDTKERQKMIVVKNQTDTKGIEAAIARAYARQKQPIYRPIINIKEHRREEY